MAFTRRRSPVRVRKFLPKSPENQRIFGYFFCVCNYFERNSFRHFVRSTVDCIYADRHKKRPPADLGRWTFPVFENIRIKLPVAETMPHFSHLPWPRRAPLSPSQSSLSAFPHILPLNERRHYEAASFRPVLPIGIFHCRTFSFPPETLAHPAGCPAGTQLPVSFG